MLPELGALYQEHAAAVWRYTRSRLPTDADAEDVTSDVFARAMRSTHTYDPAKGSPRAWLVGIARNAVGDWWRRRKPEDPHGDFPDAIASDDPLMESLRIEQIGEVRAVLAMLSEREREAIALRFGAELGSAEIGVHLGISPTAARMLVHRVVTKLRGVLTDG
ncbi:MAG: sigma-70 family RNA polymerase sigma factor [Acidimicrobiales bacterium]